MEVLAFYLPQFHPIPENDEWWGPGFTEWRNVVQARPRFPGHRQPHLPADLGFVDLRSRDALADQARLATRFGVTGFVMYHYWFRGRRLLERPIETIMADPGWPGRFCLCWANETWSRVWDGREEEVLIRQDYDDMDDSRHASELTRMMGDPRYVRLDGRPLFLIYRPASHPSLQAFCHKLKASVGTALGVEPTILGVRSSFDTQSPPPWTTVVDGVVAFQPNRQHFALADGTSWALGRLRQLLPTWLYQWFKRSGSAVKKVDYRKTSDRIVASWRASGHFEYPCIFPNWDNTARRKTPIVIQSENPGDFEHLANEAVRYLKASRNPAGPLFVNAWNEWAEGCHLEPDLRFGSQYLSALARAVGAVEPTRAVQAAMDSLG